MTQIRAWLREYAEPGWVVFLVAVFVLLAAILLSPSVPGPTTGPPPGSTIPYGQPDTMLDGLEGRVYTTEEVLAEQHQWIVELEQRIEELERERR